MIPSYVFREGLFFYLSNCLYLCPVSRILGIDYGSKKVGIAVTDPLKIIVSPLKTVATSEIFTFLKEYLCQEEVELIVIGEPYLLDGQPAQFHPKVIEFANKLKKIFPAFEVVLHDETNTSKKAKDVLLASGARKKKRRDKRLIDKIAASLLLEEYLTEKGIF